MDAVPSHDLKILMGDFNAQIDDDTQGYEDIIGKETIGTRTSNCERSLNLCSYMAFYGQMLNQIDHICISRRWASSLREVRVYTSADIGPTIT